jgi:iron(III) transport system substrate-binding protein
MKTIAVLLMASAALAAAAADRKGAAAARSIGLVVYSPHPLEFINPIVQEFEIESGIKVDVVQAGTGELLRKVEEERADPRADVVWGGSRASLEPCKSLFEPYRSANKEAFIRGYVEEGDFFSPFTAVPTVFMYNENLVPPAERPRSWADLADPKWRGRLAFADPGLSSSSFEALVAMLFAMGRGDPEKGWDYVGEFAANLGGRPLSGSAAVYNGVSAGEYAIGVTFEEAVATCRRQGAPVGVAYPAEGTVVEPDGVAVVKGARHLRAAKDFVDFVTSRKVQLKITRDLGRRSCRTDVAAAVGLVDIREMRIVPGGFVWAAANRDRIIARFKDLVAR